MEELELLIKYEQLMFIDESPRDLRTLAIDTSKRKIICFWGMRNLRNLLNLRSEREVDAYLYHRLARNEQ